MGRATSATLSITRTVFWNPLRSVLFLLATLLAVMPLVAGAAATSGPLLAGARQAATPKAGSPGEPWLDLAWIALTPADGIGEGYGAIGGSAATAEQYAGWVHLPGPAATAFEAAALEAGLRRAYLGTVASPSDEDPDRYSRSRHSALAEYADAAGATAGYGLLTAAYEEFGHDRVASAPTVGDQSAVFRSSGVARSGDRFQQLRLVFRSGDVVVAATVTDFTNDAPPTSEVVALAKAMATRIEEARAGAAPGLGLRVPRVSNDGGQSFTDRYTARAGSVVAGYRATSADLRGSQEWLSSHGVVDRYSLWQDWPDPGAASPERVSYDVTLYRFTDEERAVGFLNEAPGSFVDQRPPSMKEAWLIEEGDAFDGSAAAFATERRSGTVAMGYKGWIRSGGVVATLGVSAVPGVTREGFEALMSRLERCLPDGCKNPGAAAAPVGLVGAAPSAAVTTGAATPVPGPEATPVADPTPAAGAATPAAAGPGLDLAWLILSPSDVPAPDYRVAYPNSWGLPTYAERMVDKLTGPADQFVRARFATAMDALGWRQATFARLATPKEVDPNLFARTVDVTLVEFDNAEGATAALPAMEDILVERRRAERAAAPVVGEEAVALRYTGVAEGSGVRYDVLRLLFRAGAVVVDIAIVDYSGTTPTLAELTELGRAQAARLAAAGAEPPPGLSQQALRLIGPSVDSDHGGYSRRGGEQLRLYRQTAGGYAATAASNGDAGVIDSYSYGATIIDPSMPSPVPVDYYVNVVRLPDAAAAAAFAEHRSEGWFARPWQGVRSARRIDGGAMAPGATAFAYTYARPDGIVVPGYYVWLQVGERVAWIDVRGPGASEAAVAPLVAAQAACLEAGWCAAPVPVPPTLGRDGGVPGDDPVVPPTGRGLIL